MIRRGDLDGHPIGINLRTVELGLSDQLIGRRPLATGIDGTARDHGVRGALHHQLQRDHPGHTQGQHRSHPLHRLPRFDHAAIGRLPALEQREEVA